MARGRRAAPAPPLPDKVVSIDAALAAARLPHAFGGALALAYYAEPRTTIDIDVNLFVEAAEHDRALEALAPLGISAEGSDPERTEREGQCRWWWDRTPVDLFFAYDELHRAMRDSIRRVPFGEERIPILSPEHLAVCKALFDRPKDWLDLEQMLVGVPELDSGEIRGWLERAAGAGDQRVERFVALAARG